MKGTMMFAYFNIDFTLRRWSFHLQLVNMSSKSEIYKSEIKLDL